MFAKVQNCDGQYKKYCFHSDIWILHILIGWLVKWVYFWQGRAHTKWSWMWKNGGQIIQHGAWLKYWKVIGYLFCVSWSDEKFMNSISKVWFWNVLLSQVDAEVIASERVDYWTWKEGRSCADIMTRVILCYTGLLSLDREVGMIVT